MGEGLALGSEGVGLGGLEFGEGEEGGVDACSGGSEGDCWGLLGRKFFVPLNGDGGSER